MLFENTYYVSCICTFHTKNDTTAATSNIHYQTNSIT